MMEFPKDIDRFYSADYELVMSSGLIGSTWQYIHKVIDKSFKGHQLNSVIEVGSGNGQHFNLTRLSVSEYVQVDIRPSVNSKLDVEKAKSLGMTFVVDDAIKLESIPHSKFDGLIATCLLAHLSELEESLINWRRVVRPGGKLVLYIPNEPGLLLRASRKLTTQRKISKLGYDHEFLHWREHRNHFPAMRSMIKHVFAEDNLLFKNYPVRGLPWDLGLFTIVEIKKSGELDEKFVSGLKRT